MLESGLRQRIRREKRFVALAMHNPKLLGRRARDAVSPKVAFLERNHDPSRTLFLVGSGRSGTTWLGEILIDALHCRLLLEPLRKRSAPRAPLVGLGSYIAPDDDPDPGLALVLDRMLTGKIRNRFTDRYNTVRFPSCRVVKEVRANNLLPWISLRYPRTPVVYLLRHPVPVAWSVTELGWSAADHPGLQVGLADFLSQDSLMQGPLEPFQSLIKDAAFSPDLFYRSVLRWCLENFVPTQLVEAGRVHVVFYEHLVGDPWGELERLKVYLHRFNPTRWDLRVASVKDPTRPSHTNFRGTDLTGGPDRLAAWVDEVPAAQVQKAMSLVRAFGLDRIYGESTRPLIAPDGVFLGGRTNPPAI